MEDWTSGILQQRLAVEEVQHALCFHMSRDQGDGCLSSWTQWYSMFLAGFDLGKYLELLESERKIKKEKEAAVGTYLILRLLPGPAVVIHARLGGISEM